MKRYELKLADGGLGVFKVSVVKDPAIESTLVHFSTEKEEVQTFTDQEKKVIYSVVMRPNMDIFRKNVNGEPANVFYTPETVEQAQINYFRNNGNAATNINHSELADAKGIFPFESWIVGDAKTDRAANFGLDVKDGDWVMAHKIDNVELWNEHIKTGKLDGLSIEATNYNYELIKDEQMSTEEKNDAKKNKSIVAFLKEKFTNIFEDATANFEGEIAEVSKWWNTVINDTFEIGEAIMRKPSEDGGEPQPISAGEYELKDGSRIVTDAEGIVRFVFPAAAATDDAPEATDDAPEATDDAPEATDDAPEAETMAAEGEEETEEEKIAREAAAAAEVAAAAEAETTDEAEPTEKETALEAEIVDLKAEIATLKADKVTAEEELETMTADKAIVDAKLVKMGNETPAGESLKNLPTPPAEKMSAEHYSKMTNREKMKFNRENAKY